MLSIHTVCSAYILAEICSCLFLRVCVRVCMRFHFYLVYCQNLLRQQQKLFQQQRVTQQQKLMSIKQLAEQFTKVSYYDITSGTHIMTSLAVPSMDFAQTIVVELWFGRNETSACWVQLQNVWSTHMLVFVLCCTEIYWIVLRLKARALKRYMQTCPSL